MTYDPSRHRLVFVGGLHRSGTTLLGRLIAQHPQVSGFAETGVPADEGQHLQTVYPTAKAHGGPGRFGFDGAAHLTEKSDLCTPQNAARLIESWSAHWDLTKPLLVEKSPPNLVRTRFLQGLFPDASFVVILRHPIAVSLATQKWSQTSLRSLLRHWLVCHEALADDRPHVERLLALTYEELVDDPAACLDRVFDVPCDRAPSGVGAPAERLERRVLRAVAGAREGTVRPPEAPACVLTSRGSSGPLRLQPRGPRPGPDRASPPRAITVSRM